MGIPPKPHYVDQDFREPQMKPNEADELASVDYSQRLWCRTPPVHPKLTQNLAKVQRKRRHAGTDGNDSADEAGGLRPVMNPPRLLADALVISHLSTKAIPRTMLGLSLSIACWSYP